MTTAALSRLRDRIAAADRAARYAPRIPGLRPLGEPVPGRDTCTAFAWCANHVLGDRNGRRCPACIGA